MNIFFFVKGHSQIWRKNIIMKKSLLVFIVSMFCLITTTFAQSPATLGLSVSPVSHNKLLLNWQRVDDVNFTCTIENCGGGILHEVTNMNSFLLKNLTANTEYSLRVKIVTSTGETIYTSCQTVKTQKQSPF
jgi:hypothetical protein